MAASELVLNDVLCFLKCKFGKIATKPLKSSVLDFYKTEDICAAKSQLLRDVEQLNLNIYTYISGPWFYSKYMRIRYLEGV